MDWVETFFDPRNSSLRTLISAAWIIRGVRCILQPGSQYFEFGVPREGSDNPRSKTEGTISPFMYVRGIREVCYGIVLQVLANRCDAQGMALLLGLGALSSVGDALVVLVFGRKQWSMVLWHLLVAGYYGRLSWGWY